MAGYRRCNICRSEGHYVRDCPTVRRTGHQTHQAGRAHPRGGARPQASGRVYALAASSNLELVVRELQYDLVVATPTLGLVKTSTSCARCSVVVEGRQFKVNLICLPLQGLDVILGMDWLSTNCNLIDYVEQSGQSLEHSVVSDFLDVFPEEVSGLPP
ncbi:uncharacterized protein LOC108318885 [Vigna angularis]|uniref:uncharacterized protein LOC108318885 n=1 Tax=Phaseolus angularis TaxID=3914 RepID=UPI0022B2DA20|nr:uncharacterized protein LOC108318885 [Vigna angularis]